MINCIFKNNAGEWSEEFINEMTALECFVQLRYESSIYLYMHALKPLFDTEISAIKYRAPELHFACGCILILK